jgi:hypothetical protein
MALSKSCQGCGMQHYGRGGFCSKDCHKEYRKRKRDEIAKKKCRLCCRPGTPEEWARYRRWRKWEEKELARVDSEHTVTQESSVCH